MAACNAVSETPQLQSRSAQPLATQKIAEVGLWPQPPGLSGGEPTREGHRLSQVWGKGRPL